MRLSYNVHHAINFRSWRLGLANDVVYPWKNRLNLPDTKMECCQRPRGTYGIYYPNVWGKKHSQYPQS